MYAINSYKSFTDKSDAAKAMSLTIREIAQFVTDNGHHVAELYLAGSKVGIYTDTMGFVWNAGCAPLGYTATTGGKNTRNVYGFSSEADLEHFFMETASTGMISDPDGKVVGFWSVERGFTWIAVNPFGPVDPEASDLASAFEGRKVQVEEPVIRLDRPVKTVAEAAKKVDYTAMGDRELRAHILNKMENSNEWLRHAVVAIFRRQTEDEQTSGQTKYSNGRGYNGLDAEIMTNIANRIIANRRSLSEKELAACRKIMPKYVGQLVEVVRETRG